MRLPEPMPLPPGSPSTQEILDKVREERFP